MLFMMGTVQHREGNYTKALDFYDASLKVREAIGDKLGIATTLNNVGVLNQERGNYAEALQYFERSLKIKREIGDNIGIAATINNIGLVEYTRGDYSRALQSYQASLKMKQDLGDLPGIANSLTNIGIVYMDQGDYLKAMTHYKRASGIDQQTGDKPGSAKNLNNIGLVQFWQGDYAQALSFFQEGLRLSQDAGDRALAASILKNIGKAQCALSNYDQALESERTSLRSLEEIGDRQGAAQALEGLGDIEKARNSYRQALDYYQRSLKIREGLADRPGVAGSACTIAEVFNLQSMYKEAIEYGERGASLARELGIPEFLVEALTDLGRAYDGLRMVNEARTAYSDAITTIEQVRLQIAGSELEESRFLEKQIAPYYALVDLELRQGHTLAALTIAEQAKSRALLDVLSSGKTMATKPMTAQEKERERELIYEMASLNAQITVERVQKEPDKQRLAELDSQLRTRRREFEAFQNGLYAEHPELEVQRGHFNAFEMTEALLPDSKTAVLEFAVLEEKTCLFVLTKKIATQVKPDLGVFTIDVKRKDLENLVESLRGQFAVRDAAYSEPDKKLFDLLVKSAAVELRGKANLIIVPDGPLWDLPFQALLSGPNRFLVQDHAISYAPSLTALQEMSKPRKASGASGAGPSTTLLALGNPSLGGETSAEIKQAFMDAELGPLPDAERQVQALGSLYGSAHSKVYVGAAATEDALKAEAANCRILHLATHGIVNNASPMYSQIVLAQAPGSSDDGLLEAWEVMNMDLNADLVVLAACQTARGRYGAGEGMIGLSWAFFVAGCPTTVVSQWDVFAPSTTDLMIDFHRNLKAGMTKAESLRQAELKMMKSGKYAHPFYWAPFVVTGAASQRIR